MTSYGNTSQNSTVEEKHAHRHARILHPLLQPLSLTLSLFTSLSLHLLSHAHKRTHLKTVPIEVVGRTVGGGHHHSAFRQEGLEQPLQEQGVGNVGDLKFVEAQQPAFGNEFPGDDLNHHGVGGKSVLKR